MIWPFDGGPETPETFDYPNKDGIPIRISVPRPPPVSETGAYASWLAVYLPKQPTFGYRDPVADFAQAKRYQYFVKTGYDPEYGVRPADLITLGTGNAPIYPATPAQQAAIIAQNTAAAAQANATANTAAEAVRIAEQRAANNGNYLTSTDGTLFGFPRFWVYSGLAVAAFIMMKK